MIPRDICYFIEAHSKQFPQNMNPLLVESFAFSESTLEISAAMKRGRAEGLYEFRRHQEEQTNRHNGLFAPSTRSH